MKQPTFVFTVNKMIEELVEKNPEAARQINVDSIRKAHRDFKAENIDLPGFEERVKQEIDLAMKIAKGEARKRADRKSRQPLKYGIGDLQKSIKKVQEYSIKIFTLLGFFLPDSASW